MKRILFASTLVLMLSLGLVSHVTADKVEGAGKVTPTADKIPLQTELKINDGVLEGHIKPNDVLKKAIKAAKASDMDALKTCFNPNIREYLDEESWGEKDGDNALTNLQSMTRILKTYPDDGGTEMKQGKVGDYAVLAVKNGEASNLVAVQRTKKWDDKSDDKNWFLTSYNASDYRVDYNAPGLKEIHDAVSTGDIAKMKEHIDTWQTGVLDLITGVEDGIDGHGLLMKRFQKIMKISDKPVLLKQNGGNALAYWYHNDKEDGFLVLRFTEQTDWNTSKKYTEVSFDISNMAEFKRDPVQTYTRWVNDMGW